MPSVVAGNWPDSVNRPEQRRKPRRGHDHGRRDRGPAGRGPSSGRPGRARRAVVARLAASAAVAMARDPGWVQPRWPMAVSARL